MANELPLPWKLAEGEEAFWVEAANGTRFYYCHFADPPSHQLKTPRPSKAVARRLVERVVELSQGGPDQRRTVNPSGS